MQNSVRWIALGLVFTAVTAQAQGRPAARLTPYVGFLSSGSIANGPLGFEVGNAGAPLVGMIRLADHVDCP